MSQSNVEVQMYKFRPNTGRENCLVELLLEQNPGDQKVPGGPTVQDTHIKVPTSYKIRLKPGNADHDVKFTVTTAPNPPCVEEKDEKYCLVGVYFIHDDLPGKKGVPNSDPLERNVAADFIKGVKCNIADTPPSLTVTIDRQKVKPGDEYEFTLLVQRLSDGALGLIDPEWENE